MQAVPAVTPERYWLAVALFHGVLLAACAWVAVRWADPSRCRLRTAPWLAALARDVGLLAIFTYGVSLAATVAANLDRLERLRLGSISGRLLGQALFGEAILLGLALALRHRRAAQRPRALLLGGAALALLAVYVDAYRVEPRLVRVRRHVVDRAPGEPEGRRVRILHVTDIQTPVIGEHEERALRAGLAQGPDLIVMTGDYVQNALGRSTERQAMHDLRALMARIGFRAPLGVFATEGDAGPPCRVVFAGAPVRCLVDETQLVSLPEGGAFTITGLSRNRGRNRDRAWLGRLLRQGPPAAHRIIISHAPDFVDALPEPMDLVLAGHTHGGQVVLPFLGPPHTAMRLPRRYAGGLNDYRGTPLHVSRGVGMERGFAPPVRFLCPPEVCIVDVRLPAGAPTVVAAR